MAEKRRLFIDPNRLSDEIDSNGELILTSNESHYLSRVLRMRSEDLLEVIDGEGHLWNAKIVKKKTIKLINGLDKPLQVDSRERPSIGIAVVIPKQGFENFLQMSCEIGVDIIQPLISKRSVVKECNNEKIIRFQKIIQEAVEQSERLWSPELMQALTFSNWINDVTGGRRDIKILDVVSKFNCPFVITHSRGNSQNMNQLSNYQNVLSDVKCSLDNLIKNALEKNISERNIIVDPGIGFSKDIIHNLVILRYLDVFKKWNLPILIGASRKRFIGEILNEKNPKERDIGTLAISCLCSQFNIDIVRVHNVKLNYQILKVADRIYRK